MRPPLGPATAARDVVGLPAGQRRRRGTLSGSLSLASPLRQKRPGPPPEGERPALPRERSRSPRSLPTRVRPGYKFRHSRGGASNGHLPRGSPRWRPPALGAPDARLRKNATHATVDACTPASTLHAHAPLCVRVSLNPHGAAAPHSLPF